MRAIKKIIITGINGQDGKLLSDLLAKKDSDNYIIGIGQRESTSSFCHRYEKIDITNTILIKSFIQEEKPDFFFNLAAQTSVGESWNNLSLTKDINCRAVESILEGIYKYSPKTKFFNAGSSEEFAMYPRSPYGLSKAQAHIAVRFYRDRGIFAVQPILHNHESEYKKEYFATKKIAKNAARIKLELMNYFNNDCKKELIPEPVKVGNIYGSRDFSYAGDFVEAFWEMMQLKEPKDYTLCSGKSYSIKEFIEECFASVGIIGKWSGEGLSEKFGFWDKGNYINLVEVSKEFYREAGDFNSISDNSYSEAFNDFNWSPKLGFKQLAKRITNYELENYNKTRG